MVEHMLDVSSNNHPNGRRFDYVAAKDAGYTMVYVKATQGDYYVNTYLLDDVEGFKAAGFTVGVYHYFDATVPSAAQADYFQRFGIGRVSGLQLVPVLDYETGSPNAPVVKDFMSLVPCRLYVDRNFASALRWKDPIWLGWPGWGQGLATTAYGTIAAVQNGAPTVPGLGITDHSLVLDKSAFAAAPTVPAPVASPYPIVGMAACPTGGYWLVNSGGEVYSFGGAQYYGGCSKLNKPAVGMVATTSGNGYYIVAADGGVFTFGDAKFYGSIG